MKKVKTAKEYFSSLSREARGKMEEIRKIIKEEAPEAEEILSYQMPAFKLNKRILIYYAAWKKHIALYPYPSATSAFRKELLPYKTLESTVQFLLDKSLPLGLIRRIIRFRVKENLDKIKKKSKKR